MKLHIKLLLLLGIASYRGAIANQEQQTMPESEQTTVEEISNVQVIPTWHKCPEEMTPSDFIEMVNYINSKRETPLVIISKQDLTGCTFFKLKCGSCKKVSSSDLAAPVIHITQDDLPTIPEKVTLEDLTLSQTIPTPQETIYTDQN